MVTKSSVGYFKGRKYFEQLIKEVIGWLAWFHGHCGCTVAQGDVSQVLPVCVIDSYEMWIPNAGS